MKYVADLHLHSKYSRAVSKDMVLPTMARFAQKKGINILSVSDWTHPLWLREVRSQLEEAEEGLYRLKSLPAGRQGEANPLFLLSVEVSSIYSQGGRLRRIHNLIFAPSFEVVEKINQELTRKGVNLSSDGRPIMGLTSRNLIELVLSIDGRSLLIPCHAWTPWFSLYGSNSGFDSIEECFGSYAKYIYGIETGLSSDPQMNWGIEELKKRSILSFSDAHSPLKMAREATVFELEKPNYNNIRRAIMRQSQFSVLGSQLSDSGQPVNQSTDQQRTKNGQPKTDNRIACTIEFYPEEGKYHYTGHRNCRVVQTPEETKTEGVVCRVCRKTLTIGVEHRVQELSKDELVVHNPKTFSDPYGTRWFQDPSRNHPPFVKLVPLVEILAESLASTTASVKVREAFEDLCSRFGSEINVLLKTSAHDLEKYAGQKIAEGIIKVRKGEIVVEPGFDGEYGKVRIWNHEGDGQMHAQISEGIKEKEQLGLF